MIQSSIERLHFHFSLPGIGEGNDNPLQGSCLENPRDGGAWRPAVCGVAQSQTRLKRLSSSSSSIFQSEVFNQHTSATQGLVRNASHWAPYRVDLLNQKLWTRAQESSNRPPGDSAVLAFEKHWSKSISVRPRWPLMRSLLAFGFVAPRSLCA